VLVSIDLVAKGFVSIGVVSFGFVISSFFFFSGEGLGNVLFACGDVKVSGGASFDFGLSCTSVGVGICVGRERVGESILTGSSSSSIKCDTGGGPSSGD
jgi:hypothetical protein